MDMYSRLTLQNCLSDDQDRNEIVFMPDSSTIDLVTINVLFRGDQLLLAGNDYKKGDEEYFHLNKQQVKVLASYLQALVDDME